MKRLLPLLTILLSINSLQCQDNTYIVVSNLKEHLLVNNSYDQALRPKLNQTDITHVSVRFGLYSIYGVSEVTETFAVCGYVGVNWIDEMLQWDPGSYGNITYITLPKKEIWDPDFILTNSVTDVGSMGNDEHLIETWNDGYSIRWTYHVYTATCSLDITYYPFDEHDCTLDFSLIGYTIWEVEINITGSYIYTTFYKLNSEWDVTPNGQESMSDRGDPNLKFKFHLKRRPGYVVLSIIMPVIMLSILNLAVFLLPSNGGEKAGFAITCLLSFTVFMTVILATFPRNALVVSVFAVYLLILTLDSTIIAILALILVRITTFDDTNKPVYPFLIRFYNFCRCVSCKSKDKDTKVVKIQVDKNANSDKCQNDHEAFSEYEPDDPTWLEISNFFDLFFLIVFSIILFLSSIVYFAVAAT